MANVAGPGTHPWPSPRSRPSFREAARLARSALALGVLADLLLRSQAPGLNVLLWLLAWALAARLEARAGTAPPAPLWPLLLVVGAGLGVMWRDSDFLRLAYLGLIAGGMALAVSGAGTGRPLASGSAALLGAVRRLTRASAAGAFPMLPVLWQGGREASGRTPPAVRARRASVLRGILLGLPLVAVFGLLLASGDPVFNYYVQGLFTWDLDALLRRGWIITVFGWLAAGTLMALWSSRQEGPPPEPATPRLGGTEIVVALSLLQLLFAAFLAVQASALFGGADYVLHTLDLTYSAYARSGFFQLVAVVALCVPLLVAADWVAEARAPDRRSRVHTLSALLLASAGVMLVSAFARMRLYQSFFGLTELRFYTQVFMAWLALVLVWTGLTIARGRRSAFLPVCAWSALVLLGAVTVANPDAVLVRANARRGPGSVQGLAISSDPTGFDVDYAASLSADAVPALLSVLPSLPPDQACVVRTRLQERWGHAATDGWRGWNWSRWRARQHLGAVRGAWGTPDCATGPGSDGDGRPNPPPTRLAPVP